MDINGILSDFAKAFEKKIDKDYKIRLQFEVNDMENGIWQIDVNNGIVSVYNELNFEPEEILVLSKNTLLKLYNYEIAPLTAFAQEPNEKGEMCALIETKHKTEEKKYYPNKKPSAEFIEFMGRLHKFNNFFSKDYPTKIIVAKENCIKLHNVNSIGLLSKFDGDKRTLHVYFAIKKDEILEEPAFEFSIYVLNGNGILRIGDEKFNIEAKNYYNIKPKGTVFIENNSDEYLELIYLSA